MLFLFILLTFIEHRWIYEGMDEKIKAVHGASATAEKDEAVSFSLVDVDSFDFQIYNLLKQTQLDIVNGIQKFQEKHKKLSCSLDASGCRLKNNDSLITIHENKHLFPQVCFRSRFI